MKKLIKVSDYIWKRLNQISHSKHVFLLSGGGMMHLLDSLGKSALKPVPMHHEQAASIAAYAYGRTINSLGVCLVTSGPGATNALTGVAAAFTDSVPMIFISGQVSTLFSQRKKNFRQLGFQEFDIINSISSTTKYSKYIKNKDEIKYELDKACFLAKSGRPGPVWLDIPLDIQASKLDINKSKKFIITKKLIQKHNPVVRENKINSIIKKIKKAKRPLILFGHGTVLSNAKKEARKLVKLLNIPAQTTWNSIDLIPEKESNYFGRANSYGPRYPNFIIQNADYILTIGARLGVQHTGYNVKAFGRGAYLDMVDLDIKESKKPGLKVDRFTKGDAKDLIIKLNKKLLKSKINRKYEDWISYCKEIKSKYPTYPNLQKVKNKKFVDPYLFVKLLCNKLREDEIVALGSSGSCFTVAGQVFEPKSKQRVFNAKGMAAMGFGLPSSIGACTAKFNKRTISIIGDGGFQLNVQELQTIRSNNLKIKLFIFQNKGYHAIRVTQDTYFKNKYIGSSEKNGVSLPEIKKIANSYNLKYSQIRNNREINSKLSKILNNDKAEIIEVRLDPTKHLYPKLTSQIRQDGTMITSPLEDLYPFLDRKIFLKNMLIKPLT
jgi:acetolactate synthase I/II/III large subunit